VRRLLVVDFANIAHRAYFADAASRPSPPTAPCSWSARSCVVLARIRDEQANHVALAFEHDRLPAP
jgi:hypothetical protein